jgi:hypothetical protein
MRACTLAGTCSGRQEYAEVATALADRNGRTRRPIFKAWREFNAGRILAEFE